MKKEDDINILDHFKIEDLISIATNYIKTGGYGEMKPVNIVNMRIIEGTWAIDFIPSVKNKISVYAEISAIMGFISGYLGDNVESRGIYNIGVQSLVDNEPYIYVLSPMESARAFQKGNAIYWLKNSIIDEPFEAQKKVIVLVEGPTELESFPLLLNHLGFNPKAHFIEFYNYANDNLRTLLSILIHNKNLFFLISDNDKKEEILRLKREGLLNDNYHILEEGEFEDYITAPQLIEILKCFTPNIGITEDYIVANRRNNNTSRIIQKIYHDENLKAVQPSKVEIGKEIIKKWASEGLPYEIERVIKRIMNLS